MMLEVISSFRSVRAGSQVFALPWGVILHTVVGYESAVAMHFTLCILCWSAIKIMFVKIVLAVSMLVGIVV